MITIGLLYRCLLFWPDQGERCSGAGFGVVLLIGMMPFWICLVGLGMLLRYIVGRMAR